ncbi:MAG: hypothetical protein QME16_04405, partial [Planctomycetota bacterium]|nr:hypothetical protein [Planctomycetota bacterium]
MIVQKKRNTNPAHSTNPAAFGEPPALRGEVRPAGRRPSGRDARTGGTGKGGIKGVVKVTSSLLTGFTPNSKLQTPNSPPIRARLAPARSDSPASPPPRRAS